MIRMVGFALLCSEFMSNSRLMIRSFDGCFSQRKCTTFHVITHSRKNRAGNEAMRVMFRIMLINRLNCEITPITASINTSISLLTTNDNRQSHSIAVLHLLLLVTNRVMEHCTWSQRCIFFNVYKRKTATTTTAAMIQKYGIEVLQSNNAAANNKNPSRTFYWWTHSMKIDQCMRMQIKNVVRFEYIE